MNISKTLATAFSPYRADLFPSLKKENSFQKVFSATKPLFSPQAFPLFFSLSSGGIFPSGIRKEGLLHRNVQKGFSPARFHPFSSFKNTKTFTDYENVIKTLVCNQQFEEAFIVLSNFADLKNSKSIQTKKLALLLFPACLEEMEKNCNELINKESNKINSVAIKYIRLFIESKKNQIRKLESEINEETENSRKV